MGLVEYFRLKMETQMKEKATMKQNISMPEQ